MAKFVNRIWHLLIENWLQITESIPITLSIFFTFYTIRMNQITKMSVDELLPSILLILGLLATSILLERFGTLRGISQLNKETHDYLISKDMNPSLDSIMSDRKSLQPLEDRLQNAKDIAITGGSLFRLANEYLGYFERKAQDGCSLKFLLLKPKSPASRLVAEYVVYEIKDQDTYDAQLRAALDNLDRLKQKYGNLVEIRTYECVPPFSLLICDPEKEYGSIMVELYTYKVPTRDRPQFILQARREPVWYKFFREQFSKMWENATLWPS